MAYTPEYSPSTVNTVALAITMAEEIEKELVQKSVVGILADDKLKARFMGNGIVILPDIEMQALGDYDRDTGFASGSITINHTPFQLSMDRGRSFEIDAQDADESGIANLAGTVMKEFVRTKAVPEIDAYTLSKIVGFANTASHVEDDTAFSVNTIYGKLIAAINNVQNAAGYDEELVCFVDSTIWGALQTSTEFSRTISVDEVKKGELSTKVTMLNGVPIFPVSSARMKSAYTFYDGTTEDEEDGGFAPTVSAKDVGFIVLPKKAVSLIKKVEKMRLFAPDQNINKDAWKTDVRVYYDAFLRPAYANTIYALTYAFPTPTPDPDGDDTP